MFQWTGGMEKHPQPSGATRRAALAIGGWSQTPGNPAALRTPGCIPAPGSAKKGVRKKKDVAALRFMQKSERRTWEKTPRMFPRSSSMPATFQAKLSLAFHAGEAMEWRAGVDN